MTRHEARIVSLLAVLFAFQYALHGLFRHWRFGSSAFDLGIFDQAVWHLSRFEAPASTISGFSNILGDHFYPIIALFAPLYWIAPAPETLIVAQAVLFGASVVPVFLFLRDRLPGGAALGLSVAYGFFWGLQRAAAFDVHEVAFAPLAIATAILALDRQRWRLFWTAMLVLALTKEDLIPLVAFFGVYLLIQGERTRGAVLTVSSLVAFALVVWVVIPSLSDAGRSAYTGAYAGISSRPWTIPLVLVTPIMKVRTALLWLAPFAFLPLFSPLSVLLTPFVLSRFLSESPAHWGTIFHYSAPVAPILVMSAGDGLARMAGRMPRGGRRVPIVAGAAGLSVLLSLFLPGNQPHWELFSPKHYRKTEVHASGYRAIELVPRDASLVAQAAVVPHLSQRDGIFVLGADAPDAEFVIAAADLNPWPARDHEELRRLLADRRGRGYYVVFEANGWTVLRRK